MNTASTKNKTDYSAGILKLLTNIKTMKHIGSVAIDTVVYSIEKKLLKRTSDGNFELTEKAIDLLNGKMCFELNG